ncbi:MAG TPA: pitrilysin family protein [Vicinamibacterales bacterium]|nr:pitrilysin family protein [Vicinamibacterales bacterium]
MSALLHLQTPGRTLRAVRGRSVLALLAWIAWSGTAHGQVRDWPSERPPRPLAARDVKFPPYDIRTLPNGLRVVVVMHHEQPVVTLRLLTRAGSVCDPPGKSGVATLAAALLDQGTTTRSAEQIADTIDSIGGGLGTGAGSDLSFANVVVMKDSLAVGFDLLADVVRNPAFQPEEIGRQRQQALSGLRVSLEDPDYLASVVFDRLVYGFHPYGLPASGTPESLQSITAADLRAFHQRFYGPSNSILAVVGDITADEAFAGAERVFGNWAQLEAPPVPVAEPPVPTRRVIIVNKPDAVQTEIRVGHLGIERQHTDYLAMDVAVKILGGEGGNRLFSVLRSERGLTYDADANMQALKQAGAFMAGTNTRTETTAEVLRLMVDEFQKLQRERVQERELAAAQAYLAGNFPLTIETPDAIAAQVLDVLFYGLPLGEIESYRERVNAITADDIQRVARQYLKPDRLSVVLVGDAKSFVGQLKGVGFSEYEVVDLTDLDLAAADFRRASRSPAATGVAREPGAPHD